MGDCGFWGREYLCRKRPSFRKDREPSLALLHNVFSHTRPGEYVNRISIDASNTTPQKPALDIFEERVICVPILPYLKLLDVESWFQALLILSIKENTTTAMISYLKNDPCLFRNQQHLNAISC